MNRMNKLVNQIQAFDQNLTLSLPQVFDEQKRLFDEIHTASAFGEIRLDDGQTLKGMLDGLVKNKLTAFESALSKKQVKQPKSVDVSIQEIFAQKVAKTCENTQVCLNNDRVKEPPFYNMGEAVAVGVYESEQYAFPRYLDNYQLVSTPKGVLPVARSVQIDEGIAGIDWVTFSFCQSTLGEKYASLDFEHCEDALTEAIELYLDPILFDIFGFGLLQKRNKGMHHCKYSYELQDNLGLVLYGHSSKKIFVQINGSGRTLARKGWNENLYKFLKYESKKSKIGRIDLAFDDFEGEFVTLDLANYWDSQNLFWTTGRTPEVNHLGNWKRINGKGRTLTIGCRESGKFCRFYERGKKEGDNLSPWVRVEVEFKANDRHLPLEMLLSPSQYFAAAYPALEMLANNCGDYSTPEKTEITKKQSQINWDKAIEITKHQFGKYIRQFRKVYDDSDLLNMISSSKDDAPKRLKFSMAAAMQAVRINQPIASNDDGLPLFMAADYLLDKPMYEGLIHAV